jgi:hypothetical protein
VNKVNLLHTKQLLLTSFVCESQYKQGIMKYLLGTDLHFADEAQAQARALLQALREKEAASRIEPVKPKPKNDEL